ncbi:MAG: hypothetical protein WC096_09705 [Sphaerochaetaceae bacterium]
MENGEVIGREKRHVRKGVAHPPDEFWTCRFGPKYILADEKISLFRFLNDRYPKLAVVEYDRCHEVIHIFVLGKT